MAESKIKKNYYTIEQINSSQFFVIISSNIPATIEFTERPSLYIGFGGTNNIIRSMSVIPIDFCLSFNGGTHQHNFDFMGKRNYIDYTVLSKTSIRINAMVIDSSISSDYINRGILLF